MPCLAKSALLAVTMDLPPASASSTAASDKELTGKVAKALRENYPNLKKDKFIYVSL
jgi:hypothetical protein